MVCRFQAGSLKKQPWILSWSFDLLFIILPPLYCVALLFLFPGFFNLGEVIPAWAWIFFIFGTEYAHQYATFYRTYFDPSEVRLRPKLYLLVPLVSFFCLLWLNTQGTLVFWRVLTYLAAYHFIRQQYGFMRMYSRFEPEASRLSRGIDALVIYAASFYPLFYYHTHMPRSYQWANAEGEDVFFAINLVPGWKKLAWAFYICCIVLFLCKEIARTLKTRSFNVQKNLLILETLISWYVAMVTFNSAFAFYFFTQMMHSVPYIALVWAYGHKKWESRTPRQPVSLFFNPKMIIIFLGLLAAMAFIEVGFWKMVADSDGPDVFPQVFAFFKPNNDWHLNWIVPLLAVPQVTHYVLDAFIWRLRKGDPRWRANLWGSERA